MTRRTAHLLGRASRALWPGVPSVRELSATAAAASKGASKEKGSGGSAAPPPPPPPSPAPPAATHEFATFARPYVLPQRLERGVDILHDPVFNKARRLPASAPLRCGSTAQFPAQPSIHASALRCAANSRACAALRDRRALAFRWRSATGWAFAAWCRLAS